jgi:short-subunit dehydrogenase
MLPKPSSDTTAVVTGASSGIGAAIARELSGRGHHVTLVARTAGKLDELAAQLRDGTGHADVLPADLSDRAARAALPERIAALGRTPAILINNAGLSTTGPVHKADPAAEMNMVEVDVVAVVDLTTRFLGVMVERNAGAVLNVASTAAFQPLPGQAGYGACKAFVLSYSQSLAGELRGTNVSVTALCPGPVETGFGAAAGFSKDEEQVLPKFMWESVEDVAKAAVNGMARGRMVVIPGVANRVAANFAAITPRRLLVPILARGHPGLRRD